MKSVLIIDGHPLFRDFIKEKLSLEKVEVIITSEDRDAYPKMISTLPNLIIMDKGDVEIKETEFLRKKVADPNTAPLPIIITGPVIDKSKIGALARYGVIKYFTKPIKFDLLFESISQVLRIPIVMDETPCVLDVHRNGSIIFIEVAQGLNREKLALLKFRLTEMIEQEGLETPKIVIMLTNLELTFVDGLNLETLINNALDNPKVHIKNVKILSLSPFVRALVLGHTEYAGIEVSSDLTHIITSLVDDPKSKPSEIISEYILSKNSNDEKLGTIETRFYSDSDSDAVSKDNSIGAVFSVAIIDNVPQSADSIAKTFQSAGAKTEVFATGKDFMDNYAPEKYSLLILDVLGPNSMGFEIMQDLREKQSPLPVVVYTASAQRDLIVRVLSLGAALYLTKPQKPEVLLNKSIQLLHRKG